MDVRASHDIIAEMRRAGVRRDGRWLAEAVDLSIRRGEIVTRKRRQEV